MEIYATKSNFFHLTGLEDTSGNQRFDKKEFFNNAIKYKIASNFDYRDENTELKLEVILKALNYTGNFRMSGDYNHGRPNLETDILVGGQHCCLGFIEDENGYYRPNTVLEADVRNEIIESNQVLAIMQKEPKDKTYTQICYLKMMYMLISCFENFVHEIQMLQYHNTQSIIQHYYQGNRQKNKYSLLWSRKKNRRKK